ncbi:MAG: glycosyltransferase family 4 protein [Gemmataceae bacterium]
MRVVVNHLLASGRKTGVGHYTAELLRCLSARPADLGVEVFPRPWMRKLRKTWGRFRSAMAHRSNSRGRGQGGFSPLCNKALSYFRSLGQSWMARHFQAQCRFRQYDLYHETNYIPLPCDIPTVTTIYDLSVQLHPEWHPADRVRFYEREFPKGLAQCRHVLAISETCRQEVIRVLQVPSHRVTRTYLGIRSSLQPQSENVSRPVLNQLGLPEQYLLYIGTIEPRKNILRLLQGYCSLPATLRNQCPLVLAGGWGWNSEPVAEFYYREARHRGVRLIGYVRERYLAALYNGARALVYPSHYEGFGLPPLEMMACGGAVLASTAKALVEILGGQAHLIEPEDIDGWREALIRIIEDDDWRQSLRKGAVEVASPYTWERCAAETLQVYRLVIAEDNRQPSWPLRAAS